MRLHTVLGGFVVLVAATMLHGQQPEASRDPEPGVSLALARWRAEHYRDVHYRLALQLTTNATHVQGEVEIRVDLSSRAGDLILDWRPPVRGGQPEGRLWGVAVNGRTNHGARLVNEHLVVPSADLRAGINRVGLRFASPIGPGGSALTRYRDREDGSEYIYTLFVPSEASTVFPCFDQPDLKARFQLDLDLPIDWMAVGNAPEAESASDPSGGRRRLRFDPTEPISTYLLAFAAGPFSELRDANGRDPVRLFVRRSQAERALREMPEVLRLNRGAIDYFERYFSHPFPFRKYDLVLVPEFAFGGMEHAGATFLRETSILFPSQPNAQDLAGRARLIFHETCHQWFGDLVTMRWFDDLWLKEGFANFMAAKAAEALLPGHPVWLEFHSEKLRACRTDETDGTTPIWQELPNLSAAKSAYGPIVYLKAPAVLRQAEFYLGPSVFQRAVRRFVRRHAYANAAWNDLVADLEFASARSLRSWADAWVKRRGLPNIRVVRETDARGRITSLRVTQQDALGEGGLWPMQCNLLIGASNQPPRMLPFLLEGPEARISRLPRNLPPDYLFANQGDYGYGRFLLDPQSRDFLLNHLGGVSDELLRAQLWSALWEGVLETEIPPVGFIRTGLDLVLRQTNELSAQHLLEPMLRSYNYYLSDAQRDLLTVGLESVLLKGMMESATPGLRITFRRAYVAGVRTPAGQSVLTDLLDGSRVVPGVQLTSRDRFNLIGRLLALGHPGAETLLDRQARADTTDDGRRYAYEAGAARNDPATKQQLFEAWRNDRTLAESWIEAALRPFNSLEQSAVTLPYLAPALRDLPELRRTRAIFFVHEWLAAFVSGQKSREALAVVEQFLRDTDLPPELRRKVQVVAADLARTVRIRARHAD